MIPQNQSIGRVGEDLAYTYLKDRHFEVLERNYRTKFGEIDIIALDQQQRLIFVEVKTRIGTGKGMPYEAVTKTKQRHLRRAAEYFLLKNDYRSFKLSIGVISIVLNSQWEVEKFDFFDSV